MREGRRQRDAFERYFRMGDGRSLRSLQAALAEGGSRVSLRTLENWSQRFTWQSRLAGLEREAVRQQHEQLQRAITAMNERQADEGMLLQQRGARALLGRDPAEMSAADAIRAIGEGIRIERLARGAATERAGEALHEGYDPNWEAFSDEELETLRRQLERGTSSSDPPGTRATKPS